MKFHVAVARRRWLPGIVADRADASRLGEGIQETGAIAPAAIGRTVTAIAGMVEKAKRDDAVAIVAVGTAGLRMASNAGDVLSAVKAGDRSHDRRDLRRGREPARLSRRQSRASARAAARRSCSTRAAVSSQFTFGAGRPRRRAVQRRPSAPSVYTRSVRPRTVSVRRDVVDEALAAIAADLSRLDGRAEAGRRHRDGRRRDEHHRR
mgnify:CR=1 FL=1